jgi:tRNA pseudouridine32 synthase/23S rRNA pseudouridine746 synthase
MMQGLPLNVEGVRLNEEGVRLNEEGVRLNKEGVRLNKEIEILYEDEYLVVVNKPSGLLSVPGKNDEPSVESCLSHPTSAYPDGRPVKAVHRLDQDTSGVLVLAKTPDVYKTLQAYFQRRDILKRYEAVVQPEEADSGPLSAVSQAEGTIELPLLPNPYDRPRQTVNKEHGKTAITRYKLREQRPDGTYLIDFFPLTGRTHQLRVHAAHPEGLNAPIVGDRLYGTLPDAAERLMLHAAEITFTHPVTQKELHFCVPSDF